MYEKIKSLEKLVKQGFNVHKFYVPTDYWEYLELVNSLQHCTARTDHAVRSKDLPFYIIDSIRDSEEYISNIWFDSVDKDYKLIISDGIKYDNIQKYNMVARISENGDFSFEASELKIPLRHMYRHPLLSCYGNISDDVSQWHIISNKYGIDKRDIKKDLEILYTYCIYDKYFEVTKYPIEVGTKEELMIFWQIA